MSARDQENGDEKQTDVQIIKQNEQKHFALVTSPIFRRIFFLIRLLGSCLMSISVVFDLSYAIKTVFSTKLYFGFYVALCCLRTIICLIMIPCYCKKKVCTKASREDKYRVGEDGPAILEKAFKKTGIALYTALPISYFTGWYRLISVRELPKEVGWG